MAKNKKKPKGQKKPKKGITNTNLDHTTDDADMTSPQQATDSNTSSPSSSPTRILLPPQQQKTIIRQLLTQADAHGLMVDDKRFVLAAKWWDRWRQYVGYDEDTDVEMSTHPKTMSTPPSAINNLPLLQPLSSTTVDELMGAPLHHNLRENYHYVLVPLEVWDALVCWYGGGPAIARFVVQVGSPDLGNSFTRVDVYPELAGGIEEEIQDRGNFPPSPTGPTTLPTSHSSLANVCGACRKTHTKPIKRCGGCQIMFYCDKSCQKSHWRAHKHVCNSPTVDPLTKEQAIVSAHASERRGKMGLRNLGNTCFMNSALQCLSHMDVLTTFFLTNAFLKDLNKHNVLGTGGNLALEYDALIKELWYGNTSNYGPSAIKRSIARFAPQFSGYQQHDAQELLAYLLDGLHEDLNRVQQKPYIEVVESNGQELDAIVAQEAWKRHLLRNDSIIVDNVQGQFKSTVVCPICSKVSITFDPYNCIQLELPSSHERKMQVIVIICGSKPMRYGIEVPKNGTMLTLKKVVSRFCGVNAKSLIAADIYQSLVYRVIGDSERLMKLREDDRIVLYHVGTSQEEADREGGKLYYGFIYHRSPNSMVSDPLLFTYQVDTTCAQMLEKWRGMLSDHLTTISGDPPAPLSLEELAECIYLCNQDGSILRSQSIPFTDDSAFINYATLQSEEIASDYVYVSMNWTASPPASPTRPRPDLDSVVNHDSIQQQREGSGVSDGLTLSDCFRNFTKPETLDNANLWYCSTCRTHRQARKQMEIWKLPDVLIISLKRFEYRNEVLRDKLDVYVDFPLEGLDMTSFCLEPPSSAMDSRLYDLFAVSNHYGGMGFGHYTAFARSLSNQKEPYPGWYSFDDSQVSPVMPHQVKTNAAYILFYKRRQIDTSAKL